ncbi:hypothetical protein HPB47_003946 [Ixodes persulcatus]|uniref:Uncharacterized protein n=1 Tax=Ixodes persulcatus TaxID=34615 RepID=A0AC60PI59_IXOPE|nr:hypothetical protein HPB47_003946 [Ixodes persulcatus]
MSFTRERPRPAHLRRWLSSYSFLVLGLLPLVLEGDRDLELRRLQCCGKGCHDGTDGKEMRNAGGIENGNLVVLSALVTEGG